MKKEGHDHFTQGMHGSNVTQQLTGGDMCSIELLGSDGR